MPLSSRPNLTRLPAQRNQARDRIKWMFTTDKARAKLGRAYPVGAKESKSRCDEPLANYSSSNSRKSLIRSNGFALRLPI
jgi:hypothetical protein